MALRDWEVGRTKHFVSWRASAQHLLIGLRAAVKLGSAQQHLIAAFLRQRCAADRAYAQALASPAPAAEKEKAGDDAASVMCPLLSAVSQLQRSVSQARESFAKDVLEGLLLCGITSCSAEYEKTSSAVLLGLEKGLADVEEASTKASDAMAAYHRSSIEPRRCSGPGGKEMVQPDAWLQEHRFRSAVALFRFRQRTFTAEFCRAVKEIERLEVWREEMARKVLGTFCTKLHQTETAVQSLANDGIRALSDTRREHPGEMCVQKQIEKLLSEELVLPDLPPEVGAAVALSRSAAGGPENESQPALEQLQALCRLSSRPPATVLGRLSGALQEPRRWTGPQLCFAVLSKDRWLHCFHLKASKASGPRPAEVGEGVDGLEALEAEPQWSISAVGAVLTVPGALGGRSTGRVLEIEAPGKKNFLGLRSSRKEVLQADTDECLFTWITALLEAGADGSKVTLPAVTSATQLLAGAEPAKSPATPAAVTPAVVVSPTPPETTAPPPPPPPPPPPQPPAKETLQHSAGEAVNGAKATTPPAGEAVNGATATTPPSTIRPAESDCTEDGENGLVRGAAASGHALTISTAMQSRPLTPHQSRMTAEDVFGQ